MPCLDYMDSHPEIYFQEEKSKLEERLKFAEAHLCAFMNMYTEVYSTAHPLDAFVTLNTVSKMAGYKDAKRLVDWFIEHSKKDAEAAARMANN